MKRESTTWSPKNLDAKLGMLRIPPLGTASHSHQARDVSTAHNTPFASVVNAHPPPQQGSDCPEQLKLPLPLCHVPQCRGARLPLCLQSFAAQAAVSLELPLLELTTEQTDDIRTMRSLAPWTR
jgi:hypothetical protein